MKHHIASFTKSLGLAAAYLLVGPVSAQEGAEWPLSFTTDGIRVQVFKPQPESFDGASFTARAAAAIQRPTDDNPVFGAIWGSGSLAVDRTDRVGTISGFNVTDMRFPDITDETEREQLRKILSRGILRNGPPISIDWLVAALEEEKLVSDSYNNAPPEIIYRETPSLLLYIDGDPILETVKGQDPTGDAVYAANTPEMERVVNTPFLVARQKGGAYWLYGSGLWYTAAKVEGPWKQERKAPTPLVQLAASVDSSYSGERRFDVIPEIIVRTTPAVLLDLNGAPQFQPYESSSLMYATNTDKDLFLDIPTQTYYFLASGRWFSTKNLKQGPWQFVASDALPDGFMQVPEGSPKDGILAHVAGTDAAREAVRDANIPQTARVDRRTATTSVTYDGSPRFERIAGTNVYSAVNASTVVLRIHDRYYVVDNAVWFEGDSPDGPWTVSTEVPSEVNTIPPSDPNYRVRYVYIYDHNPNAVFIGYTPGYLGAYVQGGTVVYGTGYYYDPWRSTYWYPRPYTWGFNMYYNPWYGWGFGASWGHYWFYPRWYSHYRPYAWGWWGPYSYCPPVATWYGHGHYWHGSYWPGSAYRGYYGHRPSVARIGDASRPVSRDGLRPTDLYRNRPSQGVTPTRTVERDRTAAISPIQGKVDRVRDERMRTVGSDYFTDRDGNVYRDNQGTTERLQDGKWSAVPSPGGTTRPTRDSGITDKPSDRTTTVPTRERTTTRPPTTPAKEQPADRTTRPGMDRTAPPVPSDPGTIQRERARGTQRENDFRGYQQQRATPTPPQPDRNLVRPPAQQRGNERQIRPSAPAQSRPSTTPSIRSNPSPSAPSRGGGTTTPPSRGRR